MTTSKKKRKAFSSKVNASNDRPSADAKHVMEK